jgi:hypothetical protein
MAHFAKVTNGIVNQVIVAEPEFFDTFIDTSAGEWIQTSYNTQGGIHKLGGTPLRKNFASIGYVYDKDRDAFYAPQPYPSWVLNEDSCIWESPVPCPKDGKRYKWSEQQLNWIEFSLEDK